MYNPSTITASDLSGVIREEFCSYGSRIVFTDHDSKKAYVKYVAGISARQIITGSGKPLEGEYQEDIRNKEGEIVETISRPWIRLRPAN